MPLSSQAVLAKLIGCALRTVQYAITDLGTERWIQVVRIGKGKEAAYVVNDCVAWGQSRDQLRLSVFSATVVADLEDQDTATTLDHTDLRRIPRCIPESSSYRPALAKIRLAKRLSQAATGFAGT